MLLASRPNGVCRDSRATDESIVKRVEFAPAARTELDAAVDRYELERPGRGRRFAVAAERAIKLIVAFPLAGPAFHDVRPERQARRRTRVLAQTHPLSRSTQERITACTPHQLQRTPRRPTVPGRH
jgi:plasmid stabilization system protein ParE